MTPLTHLTRARIDRSLRWINRRLAEPAPDYCFAITEESLTWFSSLRPADLTVDPLAESGLAPSPGRPNLLKPQLYRETLMRISKGAKANRTRTALVIPDHAVRTAILNFDDFPRGEPERLALIRFRLRKSVPFHIDEAGLSYSVQSTEPGHVEVLVAVAAGPILKEYESLFTDAGFRVGLVVPSSLAALSLWKKAAHGLTAVARMDGTAVSLFLLQSDRLRLVRCIDLTTGEDKLLPGPDRETVLSLLGQTLAYAEDQIGAPASKVLLSGFGRDTESLGKDVQEQFGIPYALLDAELDETGESSPGLAALLQDIESGRPGAINLASQPFGRERTARAALVATCAALSCSLLLMLVIILHARAQAADLRKMLELQSATLKRLQLEQTRYLNVLSQSNNADVFAWTVLMNQLIAHRGLSWARIFVDLSTVLPPNMRLVGIRVPQVAPEEIHDANRVQLDMVVATEKPATLLDLLNALQTSELFGSATVLSQTSPTSDDPTCKFRVLVGYAQKL